VLAHYILSKAKVPAAGWNHIQRTVAIVPSSSQSTISFSSNPYLCTYFAIIIGILVKIILPNQIVSATLCLAKHTIWPEDTNGPVVSAGRAPALQAGGHGFDPHPVHQRARIKRASLLSSFVIFILSIPKNAYFSALVQNQ
jgi:hypothetical protein